VCECKGDEIRVDGRCTTCGNNCADCDLNYCNMCEYGYWLDNTETVCINWCPTGSTYDDARESGKCVDASGLHSIIDLSFECNDFNVPSDFIQRRFRTTDSASVEFGNVASWDVRIYGGANEDSIQFDDPRPI
jgi:hypothetical protein